MEDRIMAHGIVNNGTHVFRSVIFEPMIEEPKTRMPCD